MFTRFLLILAVLGFGSAYAQEQPKDLTITVSQPEMVMIWQTLAKKPWDEVAPLMAKLQGQVTKQQNPAPTDNTAPEKK